MLEPGRRDAASAGKTMMVPMSNSSLLPLRHDLAGDMPSIKSGRG
jgi:hypothetical protein